MYGNNPYAQGGWSNPQNPMSLEPNPWFPNEMQSPTYGALPSTDSSNITRYIFDFTPVTPSILNSTVIGPSNNVYFRIVTTNDGMTTILKPKDQLLARIQWGAEPRVEILGVVPRQSASQWLSLSEDKSYRTMVANGRNYMWTPSGPSIVLFSAGPTPVEFGAITRSATSVTLQLTGDAFSAGVLEAAVVATLIFQSGRNMT